MRQILILLSSLLVLSASAQTRREQIRARVDSTLRAKYNKVSFDTAFIGRPRAKLTLKVRTNLSGNSVHARGNVGGVTTKADLKTDPKATLSFGVNYQGITAGLAINPSTLKGRNKDFEVNLNAYSNRYSLDASYHVSKTLAGSVVRDGVEHYVERGFVDMKVLNVAGYYTFNYRRFSYPAAFTQSYIQKRSAGSWLAGFSYQGGRMKTTGNASSDVPQARIYVGHFGIGGGYGYNLVVREKWLFHLSALPTLVLFNRNNITVDGERKKMHTSFPDVILNERLAIVRNFSTKYFAGLTVVMSNTLFNNSSIKINQNKWRARAFFGVRL
ncbi:MAG: DUF4421 domain-containing protein [Prevotella sp.]|nr:DUF4421 domain-containing protein [Prevotella sp.]